MNLKSMGVMNVTPNSFSDGGEFFSPGAIKKRLHFLSQFEAIDIGAESTAPQNKAESSDVEWERWGLVLPHLKSLDHRPIISADTYHPETIFRLIKYWQDHRLDFELIWNDVSGKFDDAVKDFLKTGRRYIFSHNLAPQRSLTGEHMNYVNPSLGLGELRDYFAPHVHPQVLFDPCIGFSKSFDQNGEILANFSLLQDYFSPTEFILGLSRKSFLKKKYNTQERETLDHLHVQEIRRLDLKRPTWIRTHRPELVGLAQGS